MDTAQANIKNFSVWSVNTYIYYLKCDVKTSTSKNYGLIVIIFILVLKAIYIRQNILKNNFTNAQLSLRDEKQMK